MAFEARLHWQCDLAIHQDRLRVNDNALLADGRWSNAGKAARELGRVELDPAPWLQPTGQPVADLPMADFRLRQHPVAGRFYPRMAFASLAQGGRDMRPARVQGVAEGRLQVDSNHPLAAWSPRLDLIPVEAAAAQGVRLAELFDGPGMQHPPASLHIAYLHDGGLGRQDDAQDAAFYAAPRLVHHLDRACRGEIAALYGRFLRPGARVLDLMSSWESHLPPEPEVFVAGLGMNAEELAANPRLGERVVKDLNDRTGLPWADGQFDLVVCTASIEYLVKPSGVMREARRVLRPGGQCVITFSDRWFPPKAIRVWSEIHPFERLGLVLGLLAEAGFTDLHSETLRGLARPEEDRIERAWADPLFAAWGVRP
jgi:SAM-dependent methyltransferase